MEFGFLTRDLDIATAEFSIRTIADWRAARADLEAGGYVANGWFYKPRKVNSPEPTGRYFSTVLKPAMILWFMPRSI